MSNEMLAKLLLTEKLRYKKIWILNYPLLTALFLTVSVTCWTTKSPYIFALTTFLFYVLIGAHHRERIKKDEIVFISDYRTASTVMEMCSIAGFMITFGLLALSYLLS